MYAPNAPKTLKGGRGLQCAVKPLKRNNWTVFHETSTLPTSLFLMAVLKLKTSSNKEEL